MDAGFFHRGNSAHLTSEARRGTVEALPVGGQSDPGRWMGVYHPPPADLVMSRGEQLLGLSSP